MTRQWICPFVPTSPMTMAGGTSKSSTNLFIHGLTSLRTELAFIDHIRSITDVNQPHSDVVFLGVSRDRLAVSRGHVDPPAASRLTLPGRDRGRVDSSGLCESLASLNAPGAGSRFLRRSQSLSARQRLSMRLHHPPENCQQQ